MFIDPTEITSPVPELKRLIAEYPSLSLPLGVFISLLGLATIFKTLIDGFTWAYTQGGNLGVFYAIGGSCVVLLLAIIIINKALRPRPEIQDFPTPYLSRSPTIKWKYNEPEEHVTYQIVVKEHKTGEVTLIPGPPRMHHVQIRDLYGKLTITVIAMKNEKKLLSSRKKIIEIYHDAVHRIKLTGKLRVAVHADPGEEVFCFYWNDKWQGFDIDFVELIAKELQSNLQLEDPIKIEYLFYKWPEVISAPNEYKVDFAIASISITAERAKSYNIMFSESYAESQLGIVADSSRFDNTSSSICLDDLIGRNIALHKATTAAIFVEKVKLDARYKGNINFQVVDNNDELRELLKNGSVDGAIYDYQRAFSLLDHGMFVQYLKHDIEIEPDEYGITFAQISTKLQENVNSIITERKHEIREMLDERIKNQYNKFYNFLID